MGHNGQVLRTGIQSNLSHKLETRNHSYDYSPNWTPLSPITIINYEAKIELKFCNLAENIDDITHDLCPVLTGKLPSYLSLEEQK